MYYFKNGIFYFGNKENNIYSIKSNKWMQPILNNNDIFFTKYIDKSDLYEGEITYLDGTTYTGNIINFCKPHDNNGLIKFTNGMQIKTIFKNGLSTWDLRKNMIFLFLENSKVLESNPINNYLCNIDTLKEIFSYDWIDDIIPKSLSTDI